MLFQPNRKSSEAPEVVQDFTTTHLSPTPDSPPTTHATPLQPSTWSDNSRTTSPTNDHETNDTKTNIWLALHHAVDPKSASGRNLKDSEDACSGLSTARTRESMNFYAPEIGEAQRRRKRRRRWFTTGSLLAVAFLLGAGLGGGVGGGIAAKKESELKARPTITATPAPQSPTVKILDYAGCPSVNNQTYTTSSSTPSKTFVKICGFEILDSEGEGPPAFEVIDISNSTESSLDSCLDSCARKDGCLGATWYIFSAEDPARNSRCYLKRRRGKELGGGGEGGGEKGNGSGRGLQVASGVLV